MAKKTYTLKDQSTGFFDPETGLDVSRDQSVEIDTEHGAGELTMRSIRAGRLIEVNRTSKAAAATESEQSDAEENSTADAETPKAKPETKAKPTAKPAAKGSRRR